jgi:hypothetical protein
VRVKLVARDPESGDTLYPVKIPGHVRVMKGKPLTLYFSAEQLAELRARAEAAALKAQANR